jgi:hypothetical protein
MAQKIVRRLGSALFVLFCVAVILYSAVRWPAHDSLECLLADGRRIDLVSSYDYGWLVHLIPCRHCPSARENQGKFLAYVVSPWGWRNSPDVAELSHRMLDTEMERRKLCAHVGVFAGVDSVAAMTRFPGETAFTAYPSPLGREMADANLHTKDVTARLQAIGLPTDFFQDVHFSAFGQIGARRVFEAALVGPRDNCNDVQAPVCPFQAVWRMSSDDLGKTWSAPVLSTESQLFVMGRSLLDQPGVARPGKFHIGPR